MTNDKGILIKNVYYMLAYAFQVLKQSNYEEIEKEDFNQVDDLFAAILARGISQQLKQGLYREYVIKSNILPTLRGRIDIEETIRNKIQRKRVIACEYDELSENNIYNQILKTTVYYLLRSKDVASKQRKDLQIVFSFFYNIDVIEPANIHWNILTFQKSNRSYQMMINICYFVLERFIQTTESGSYRMATFSDDHMERLFEKFVLEFYKQHYNYLTPTARYIDWDLDQNNDEIAIKYLPIMKTDITLTHNNKTLVIDTKYYSSTMQTQFNLNKIRSNNLYQIFSYVKNLDSKGTGDVSGMLLYAKTGEIISPDFDYYIGGNKISVKTLDLNTDFKFIENQLNMIVKKEFGIDVKK